MRILVRNVASGEFLKSDAGWTIDGREARVFEKSAEAFEAALRLSMSDLEVVLSFDGAGADVHMPVGIMPPPRPSGMDVMVDPGPEREGDS